MSNSLLAMLLKGRSMTVGQRFDQFLENLRLTEDQRRDGITKHGGVRSCLNENYYGWQSNTANSLLVGSWGKDTQIRPPRDIDILFKLPKEVYDRFERRPGNKQSQLLQEVKEVLGRRYGTTSMRGDGQVVMVKFSTYAVEVLPAIELTSGQFYICDTNSGGRYKIADPMAEIKYVRESSESSNGNTRDLIRMMKCWQSYCGVPLKSFCIELVAIGFLKTWVNAGKGTMYYDWMVRDFFQHLLAQVWTVFYVPGTSEMINLGADWKNRAESAYDRAKKACDYENSSPYAAGEEWQKIFGSQIPIG